MQNDFADAADACADILLRLARDFPDSDLEMTFHGRGQVHSQHHIGRGQALAPILQQHTSSFEGARVFYTPHHPYGLVCLIESGRTCPVVDAGEAGPWEEDRSCIAILVLERDCRRPLAGRHMAPLPGSGIAPRRPWRIDE